ncbi:MAG TPA: hypothetical protein VF406_15855 [Thermodesulfobacteriota bacterium]
MGVWSEIADAWFGPPDLRSALARMRAAKTAGERLDAARLVLRAKAGNETARRVLADERLWTAAFFDRFTAEVERVGAKAVAVESYRDLVAEARRFVTHPRAMAAARAAVLWVESARAVDNIGLTEAERLLRGFGYPALADRVKADIAAVKALGHSGPIRERKAKGLPLPPPTRWSVAQAG